MTIAAPDLHRIRSITATPANYAGMLMIPNHRPARVILRKVA